MSYLTPSNQLQGALFQFQEAFNHQDVNTRLKGIKRLVLSLNEVTHIEDFFEQVASGRRRLAILEKEKELAEIVTRNTDHNVSSKQARLWLIVGDRAQIGARSCDWFMFETLTKRVCLVGFEVWKGWEFRSSWERMVLTLFSIVWPWKSFGPQFIKNIIHEINPTWHLQLILLSFDLEQRTTVM